MPQSHFSPRASSKAQRGVWGPHLQTQQAVGRGPGLCYSGVCSLSLPLSQPCCKAAAVQLRCPKCREEPYHHLSKGFIFFFVWKLATRQHAHTALFTYPEKALSAGCLAVRRSRIKSEGFKGRASLSNYSLETRGSHRPWAWPWIFPKK